jgi:alkanesulfonate monooxygenase SsuD/methylene tetrahydromethanopterin reductase-like flavin-dependent oxidoreductase (luciferase family)
MPDIMLRYDLRLPDFSPASSADQYQAAIDQCAWAEQQGFASVHISEHHTSEDGYLPSPMVLASAIAGRTSSMRILISALIAPLHNPVRLAEDLAVLDIISRGRVIPVLSAGYRREEFEAVGKTPAVRKEYMDFIMPFLKAAWAGEEVEYEGNRFRITPRPHTQPRPMLFMGGSSKPAARRAAAHADYFIPSGPEIFEYYREELRQQGKPDPGPMPDAPATVTFVAEDPDAYWGAIAPHVQHETNAYAGWAAQAGTYSPYKHYDDTDELREAGAYRVFSPRDLIETARAMPAHQPILFHPLCGGISPELAWDSLKLFAQQVLPVLREEKLLVSAF